MDRIQVTKFLVNTRRSPKSVPLETTSMTREVKLNQIEKVLSDLTYPIDHDRVVTECSDVTLVLAEGQQNLGELLEESTDDRYENREDLKSEILNLLPRRAVGEPFQSEGDA